jgi:hypothetical protein
MKQWPLFRDVLFGSLAHYPRERDFFFFRDAFEGFVNVRRETDRRAYRRSALDFHFLSIPLFRLHGRFDQQMVFTTLHHFGERQKRLPATYPQESSYEKSLGRIRWRGPFG